MRYPMKFISRHTIENSINGFTISIGQSNGGLIPLGLGFVRPSPSNFDGVLHNLIDSI